MRVQCPKCKEWGHNIFQRSHVNLNVDLETNKSWLVTFVFKPLNGVLSLAHTSWVILSPPLFFNVAVFKVRQISWIACSSRWLYPKPYNGSLPTVAQSRQLMLGIIIMEAKAGAKRTLQLVSRMLCCTHLLESCRNIGWFDQVNICDSSWSNRYGVDILWSHIISSCIIPKV